MGFHRCLCKGVQAAAACSLLCRCPQQLPPNSVSILCGNAWLTPCFFCTVTSSYIFYFFDKLQVKESRSNRKLVLCRLFSQELSQHCFACFRGTRSLAEVGRRNSSDYQWRAVQQSPVSVPDGDSKALGSNQRPQPPRQSPGRAQRMQHAEPRRTASSRGGGGGGQEWLSVSR